MATVLVRHKLKDYAKWKAVYTELQSMVKAKGGSGQRLLRNSADPNEVVILSEFGDMAGAQEFARSQELRQGMERAGVADAPTVFFLEEVEDVTF